MFLLLAHVGVDSKDTGMMYFVHMYSALLDRILKLIPPLFLLGTGRGIRILGLLLLLLSMAGEIDIE